MSRRWGGGFGDLATLQGLETAYENGTASRAVLIRALRRCAGYQEADAERIAFILPETARFLRDRASDLRRKANRLEQVG